MSKGAENQRLTPDERSNLVAFIDGELNESESRAISTKLTQSVSARREVDALKRTWELLDELPMPRASESLTQRTLTEIAKIDTAGDKLFMSASRTARKVLTTVLVACGTALCFVIGLVITRWLIPDPTARLARELSIAEHYQEYREIGTLEFLKRLDESPEFGNDPN